MLKLEYDSFYKFVVSLGVALMSLAILASWLFFKEPFDLLLESSKISQLTPVARDIINYKQTLVLKVLQLVPWVSLFLLFTGFVVILVGLFLWSNKQKVLDKQQELANKKLEAEIKSIQPAEKVSSLANEVAEDIANSEENIPQNLITEKVTSSISRYLEIENIVYGKISDGFSDTHDILRDKRISNVDFDVILQSKENSQTDYIVEIKYVRGIIEYGWLRSQINRLGFASRTYKNATNRPNQPVLLIVTPQANPHTLMRIEEVSRAMGSMVLVEVFTEDGLSSTNSRQLRNKISVT